MFFGLWNGWGRLDQVYPSEVFDGPKLMLTGRDYLVLGGVLSAAKNLGGVPAPRRMWPQSPNLIWPADHTWCVATEIDFDSTLVAGDRKLIDAVLRRPDLEAWPVSVDDSLRFDGDLINQASDFG